jgi:hypothetical protein
VTLREAFELAELVEESREWTVTAVGRFLMMKELVDACADGLQHKLPWMVMIMAQTDPKTLIKLTCMQDWLDLQIPATKRPKRESKPAICETKAAKTETKLEQSAPAGMLF